MTEPTKPPVVFIHGLWLHASSWEPWIELFAQAGYQASAPTWPGEASTVAQTRENPDAVADFGIEEVTDHFRKVIDGLGVRPIVIGHSFGGLFAQKLLGEDLAAGAIGIDAAQIKGVLPLPLSALHSTLPVFKSPANLHKAVSLTAEQFRYSFGNAIEQPESDELHERWTVPSPGKPLFQAAAANFSLHSPAKVDTDLAPRGPLLLIAGGKDHTVPEVITKSTAKQYRHSSAVTDVTTFADRGHSLTIDGGWREVATTCLTWLGAQGL
ncbi:alpha/beta hydrolase [Pseudofrankia asymbiotica]|uniref:Alpha/beta hydrolase n=1 Tax=Pseudofrankia asymbiotica TaxID=1834516 RepID=A0A1V2ID62_9ACTN|nr:alpha/beta hydrolase [Pseudofrankia asymbiotica]ONH31057.1 alpha/beta hydrolase [Pseudofrankia asymbiotica]